MIRSPAPAAVCGRFIALQRDRRHKVFDPQHLIGKGLIDKRGVCKAQKHTVGMHLANPHQVGLAHQRFAAGVDVDINAQLPALADDPVNFLKAQVQPPAVFRRPAASAAEIACAGRVRRMAQGMLH